MHLRGSIPAAHRIDGTPQRSAGSPVSPLFAYLQSEIAKQILTQRSAPGRSMGVGYCAIRSLIRIPDHAECDHRQGMKNKLGGVTIRHSVPFAPPRGANEGSHFHRSTASAPFLRRRSISIGISFAGIFG
jgi:hypothetical protein